MKQPAQKTQQGGFGIRLTTQLQLALQIRIEQRLKHWFRLSSDRVRSTPDWRGPNRLPRRFGQWVVFSPSVRSAPYLPQAALSARRLKAARWLTCLHSCGEC